MGVVNLMESSFKITKKNITVVGLGVIGGSFAMALKDLKPNKLWGIDINETTLDTAENMGIIDEGYTEADIPLRESDLVIISLYPKLTERFIRDNLENFKSGAIITDVAGIKEELVNSIASFIRPDLDFIGGHPMAGRESKGIDYASKDIFKDANYIFTPTENNKEENIRILEDITKQIGCKNVVRVNAAQHDQIIAFTSQLPHILAVALLNSGEPSADTSSFIAGSFRDGTRVGDINVDLWTELLTLNRENIINKLGKFEKNISMIKNAISEYDHSLIRRELERAGKRRRELIHRKSDSY